MRAGLEGAATVLVAAGMAVLVAVCAPDAGAQDTLAGDAAYEWCPAPRADGYAACLDYGEGCPEDDRAIVIEPRLEATPHLCRPYRVRIQAFRLVGPEEPISLGPIQYGEEAVGDLHERLPDLNGDGVVGIPDFFPLLRGFVTRGGPYDWDDFACWRDNFGREVAPTAPRAAAPSC